jgi:hypothetical protein
MQCVLAHSMACFKCGYGADCMYCMHALLVCVRLSIDDACMPFVPSRSIALLQVLLLSDS